MMEIFVTLGISLGLGLLIGLQRERAEARVGGIRTFPLISLFGTFCALLAASHGWGILLAGFLVVFGVLAVSNVLKLRESPQPEPGQTTEVAALLTFALGAYLVGGDRSVAFVAAGVTVVLLHLKEPMHRFVGKMGGHDVSAVMQFVVITLIILPLLPNRAFGPYEVLNPFDIWRMVVLIVGLSLSGYVVYKIWGERAGTISGGVLGGLISSTATTVSYARRSREALETHRSTVFVIIVASAIAYGRVLIEIGAVAPRRAGEMIAPLTVLLGWMALVSVLFYPFRRSDGGKIPEPANPAELKSALVFGAIYAVVIFAIGAVKHHLGPTALYGVAIASGLTDMDAITLSTARFVEQERLDSGTGWRLILTASLANIVFKAGAAMFIGGVAFGRRLLLPFGLGLAGGLVILWLWPAAKPG
jgi:uncharacterized membrane protein (DUF4010 family)